MDLSYVVNKELPIKVIGSNSAFKYEIIPNGFIVLQSKDGKTYACSNNRKSLHKSVDDGKTWGSAIYTTTSIIEAAHKTSTGVLLVFERDNTVKRSTDDAVFTQVLTNVYSPWPTVGVDSSGDTIIFGEYGAPDNGVAMKVWKSINGGVNWTPIITEVRGEEGFSHFHSCHLLSTDFWLVTTGDQLIRWYISTNNGNSFSKLFSTDQFQIFRTIGAVEITNSELYKRIAWASDGAGGSNGVYAIDLEPSQYIARNYTPELLTTLPHCSVGMTGTRNILVATTDPTNVSYQDKKGYVYVSTNSGKDWQIDASFQVKATAIGGIRTITMPDYKGNYYLLVRNLEGEEFYEQTVKMTLDLSVITTNNGMSLENRRLTQTVIPRAIYNTHKHVLVAPPKWARSAIFMCRTFAITGTTPSSFLWTRQNFPLSDKPSIMLKSEALSSNKTAVQYWMPSATLGQATIDGDVKIAGLPPVDSMQVSLIVAGTFATGEGVDALVDVTWMP